MKDSNQPSRPLFSNPTREKRTAILAKLGFVIPALAPENVPAPLKRFIPVAEFWGLPEDAAMKELVDAATEGEIEILCDTVQELPEEFDRWLATPPPEPGKISREYIRFSCLCVAYEFAQLRLKPKKSNPPQR